jgi:DNA-binding transcriptional ArsR family regulator
MRRALPLNTPELRGAMLDVLNNQLRTRVYSTVFERSGVTIKQISERIGEPPRRVRHQIELLLKSGLVEIDAETPRGNRRERHYTARWIPTIHEDNWDDFTDEQRRKIATSVLRIIISDVGLAVKNGTFGTGTGHAEVRIPGEVDRRGWEELARVMVSTTTEIEEIMVASAERLRSSDEEGIEAISALLLFETAPWEPTADGDPPPPRALSS